MSLDAGMLREKLCNGSLTLLELAEALHTSKQGERIWEIDMDNGSVMYELCEEYPEKLAALVGADPVAYVLGHPDKRDRKDLMGIFLTEKIFPHVVPEATWEKVVAFLYDYDGIVDAATAYIARGLDRRFAVQCLLTGIERNTDGILLTLLDEGIGLQYWTNREFCLGILDPQHRARVVQTVVEHFPKAALLNRNVLLTVTKEDRLRDMIGAAFNKVEDYDGLAREDLAWLPIRTQYEILHKIEPQPSLRVDCAWLIALYDKVSPTRQTIIRSVLGRTSIKKLLPVLKTFASPHPHLKTYCIDRCVKEGYLFGQVSTSLFRGRLQYQVQLGGNVYIHNPEATMSHILMAGDTVVFKTPAKPLGYGAASRKFLVTFIPA